MKILNERKLFKQQKHIFQKEKQFSDSPKANLFHVPYISHASFISKYNFLKQQKLKLVSGYFHLILVIEKNRDIFLRVEMENGKCVKRSIMSVKIVYQKQIGRTSCLIVCLFFNSIQHQHQQQKYLTLHDYDEIDIRNISNKCV